MFNVCTFSKNCPPARHTSIVNVVCKDTNVFGSKAVLIFCNGFLNYYNINVFNVDVCVLFLPHNGWHGYRN